MSVCRPPCRLGPESGLCWAAQTKGRGAAAGCTHTGPAWGLRARRGLLMEPRSWQSFAMLEIRPWRRHGRWNVCFKRSRARRSASRLTQCMTYKCMIYPRQATVLKNLWKSKYAVIWKKIKIKSRCCYLVITYKFCWVWKLYKSAIQFPMANQLNFPYLSIFIAFGWCLLLGAGGRSLIRVIHVLNKASCPPATPWCHRLHAWDWAGTPAASTPRGWAASTAHSGPCRAACGAAKRVPPKGHPGASQRPLWGLMLSLLRLLLEIMAAGEVSLYKDPLLEQQLPPGGGGEGWVGASPLSSCSYLFRRRRAEMSVLLTVCKVPGIAVLSFVWGDAPQSRQREPGSPGEAVSQQNPFVLTATTEKEVVLRKMHLPQCQRREKNVFCNCTDGTEEHDR